MFLISKHKASRKKLAERGDFEIILRFYKDYGEFGRAEFTYELPADAARNNIFVTVVGCDGKRGKFLFALGDCF